MSLTRKLVIAFWIFVVGGILWTFYSDNQDITKQDAAQPTDQHYYFYHTNAPSAAPVHHDGADVQQVGYTVDHDTPSPGTMTCHVTLKNVGNAKAVDVQVSVRPFRGASNYDEDVGHSDPKPLSDDDPVSQISAWISFPDLAPGESSTQSAVFLSKSFMIPGTNPKPEIVFKTEKTASPAAHNSGL